MVDVFQQPSPAIRASGEVLSERTLPVSTLADICAEHVRGPIEFLKIDVECHEKSVLLGADWLKWRPRVVLVESPEPDEVTELPGHWHQLLLKADYLFGMFERAEPLLPAGAKIAPCCRECAYRLMLSTNTSLTVPAPSVPWSRIPPWRGRTLADPTRGQRTYRCKPRCAAESQPRLVAADRGAITPDGAAWRRWRRASSGSCARSGCCSSNWCSRACRGGNALVRECPTLLMRPVPLIAG